MRRGTRVLLLSALVLTSGAPFLLLAFRALGPDWFFPALLPRGAPEAAWRALGSSRLWHSTVTGVLIALATGVIATLVAMPAGRAISRLRGWRRYVAAGAAFLPVAAPPIALGTGLQLSLLALGGGGRPWGVLLAHLVPAIGYLALFFLGVFDAFDRGLELEARSLGADRWQVWRHVLLPLLRRPIAEAVALGFLVSWAQVPLTLLVGAGAVRTLPVEIMSFVASGQDQLAAAGGLLLVLPALLALSGAALVARSDNVIAL